MSRSKGLIKFNFFLHHILNPYQKQVQYSSLSADGVRNGPGNYVIKNLILRFRKEQCKRTLSWLTSKHRAFQNYNFQGFECGIFRSVQNLLV